MLLYDFGRTGNALDAARWDTRSSEQDRSGPCRTNPEVKQAYYALLAAKNLVDSVRKSGWSRPKAT